MAENQSVVHHVVLYSKPGCHLCEDALALLNDLKGEHRMRIEEINIESETTLLAKYLEKIPVLVIDGRVTLAAPIRKRQVLAALEKS
jgi:glutaredoxin